MSWLNHFAGQIVVIYDGHSLNSVASSSFFLRAIKIESNTQFCEFLLFSFGFIWFSGEFDWGAKQFILVFWIHQSPKSSFMLFTICVLGAENDVIFVCLVRLVCSIKSCTLVWLLFVLSVCMYDEGVTNSIKIKWAQHHNTSFKTLQRRLTTSMHCVHTHTACKCTEPTSREHHHYYYLRPKHIHTTA